MFYSGYESKNLNFVKFIVDTGATEHMVNDKQYFANVRKV